MSVILAISFDFDLRLTENGRKLEKYVPNPIFKGGIGNWRVEFLAKNNEIGECRLTISHF